MSYFTKTLEQRNFEKKLRLLAQSIPPEQESDIIEEAKRGDVEAQEKLFAKYGCLFNKFCDKYEWLIEQEDALNECFEVFKEILPRFDPKKGYTFGNFIIKIGYRSFQKRMIILQSEKYGVEVDYINKLNTVRKLEEKLRQELGRFPTREELINKIKYENVYKKDKNIIELIDVYYRVESPNQTIFFENNGEKYDENIALQKKAKHQEQDNIENLVTHKIFYQSVMKILKNQLEPWQLQTLLSIHSMQDKPPYDEIAKKLNVSSAKLRQFIHRINNDEHGKINKIRKLLINEVGIKEIYPDLVERFERKTKQREC